MSLQEKLHLELPSELEGSLRDDSDEGELRSEKPPRLRDDRLEPTEDGGLTSRRILYRDACSASLSARSSTHGDLL